MKLSTLRTLTVILGLSGFAALVLWAINDWLPLGIVGGVVFSAAVIANICQRCPKCGGWVGAARGRFFGEYCHHCGAYLED